MFGSFQLEFFELTSRYHHNHLFQERKQYGGNKVIPNSYYNNFAIFANEGNNYLSRGRNVVPFASEPRVFPIQRFYQQEQRQLGVDVRMSYNDQNIKRDISYEKQDTRHEPQKPSPGRYVTITSPSSFSSSSTANSGDSATLSSSPVSLEIPKAFSCSQCKYTTDRKNNLKRHIVTMHFDSDRKLECCGTTFRSKAKLREHVTLFHKNGYRCSTCGRIFCRKALLRRHMTVHSGKKDFHCDLCSYATSHKSNLERHQKVHIKTAAETTLKPITDPIYIRKTHIRQYTGSFQNMRKEQLERFPSDIENMELNVINRKATEIEEELNHSMDTELASNFGSRNDISANQIYFTKNTKTLSMMDTAAIPVITQDKSSNTDQYMKESVEGNVQMNTDKHDLDDSIKYNKENIFDYEMLDGKRDNDRDDRDDRGTPLKGVESHGSCTVDSIQIGSQNAVPKDGNATFINIDVNENTVSQVQNVAHAQQRGSDVVSWNIMRSECVCAVDKENSCNTGYTYCLGISERPAYDTKHVDETCTNLIYQKTKLARRLCKLPYRCSMCREQFECQNNLLLHVCENDAKTLLSSIENSVSLVTLIRKRGENLSHVGI